MYSDTKISIKGADFNNSLVFLKAPMRLTAEEKSMLDAPLTLDLGEQEKAARLFSALMQKMKEGESFIILAHRGQQHEIKIISILDEELQPEDSSQIHLYQVNKTRGHLHLVNISHETAKVIRPEGRVRLPIAQTDNELKRELQTRMINGEYDPYWRDALEAAPCGALDLKMQKKMLERSRLQGNDRWVTIGRDIEKKLFNMDGQRIDIANDFDLGVLGDEISVQHGSLGVIEKKSGKHVYVYMDDGSHEGTRVVRRIKNGEKYTVFGNFAIPRNEESFLTFTDLLPDVEIEDTEDAKVNQEFSRRILLLKKGESLELAIDEHGEVFFDGMPDARQSFSRISITGLGNREYALSNSGSQFLEVVRLLNPILAYPGKMQVEERDRIVFCNLNKEEVMLDGKPFTVNDERDLCFIVPPPYETLAGRETQIARKIEEIEKTPARISGSADWQNSFSVEQYVFDTASQMQKTERQKQLQERAQRQNQFADAAGAGDIEKMEELFPQIDINATTRESPSKALSLAIRGARIDAIKWLLAHGAHVGGADGDGEDSPLATAEKCRAESYGSDQYSKYEEILALLVEVYDGARSDSEWDFDPDSKV